MFWFSGKCQTDLQPVMIGLTGLNFFLFLCFFSTHAHSRGAFRDLQPNPSVPPNLSDWLSRSDQDSIAEVHSDISNPIHPSHLNLSDWRIPLHSLHLADSTLLPISWTMTWNESYTRSQIISTSSWSSSLVLLLRWYYLLCSLLVSQNITESNIGIL